METQIFKTYSDFLNREDWKVNGVSEDFAKANPTPHAKKRSARKLKMISQKLGVKRSRWPGQIPPCRRLNRVPGRRAMTRHELGSVTNWAGMPTWAWRERNNVALSSRSYIAATSQLTD